MATALRRSPRASAWLGRRDPADVPPLCRSLSYRLRGDADARLVPAHRADDRSVRAGASGLGQSSSRAPATATRAFLRFLATRGVVPASIEGAVPTIREWKHATLPRALADDDMQRVLAAVDETRPNGRRDRAILLLLSRLGLRAGEAAVLTVKDIDWHNGVVRVAGKGRRERRLPLPADVGAALGGRVALAAPDQLTGCDLRYRAAAVSAAQRLCGRKVLKTKEKIWSRRARDAEQDGWVTLDARADDDLGRFGLGLKTASFSQCRRLTVASRQEGGAVACLRALVSQPHGAVQAPPAGLGSITFGGADNTPPSLSAGQEAHRPRARDHTPRRR